MTPEMQIAEVAPREDVSKLYPLDDREIIVTFYRDDKKKLQHRLRRPTAEELHERGQGIRHEVAEVSKTEEEQSYQSREADLALWEKIVLDVKGYRAGSASDGTDWVPANKQIAERGVPIKSLIPAGDKLTAVHAYLNASEAEIELDGSAEPFDLLAAPEYRVLVSIGDRQVVHVCRQPTEEEWQEYNRRTARVVSIRGAKRPRSKIHTNYTAAFRLYDAILLRIEGASVRSLGWADHLRDEFVAAVDPWHKRQVVLALVEDYAPTLLD